MLLLSPRFRQAMIGLPTQAEQKPPKQEQVEKPTPAVELLKELLPDLWAASEKKEDSLDAFWTQIEQQYPSEVAEAEAQEPLRGEAFAQLLHSLIREGS